MAAIRDHPEHWNQACWHSRCGTSHCLAGRAQILGGRDPGPDHDEWVRADAREFLGLDLPLADYLFAGRRTLAELEDFTGFLTADHPAGFSPLAKLDRDGYGRNGRDDRGFDRDGFDRTDRSRNGFLREHFVPDGTGRLRLDCDRPGRDREGFLLVDGRLRAEGEGIPDGLDPSGYGVRDHGGEECDDDGLTRDLRLHPALLARRGLPAGFPQAAVPEVRP